MLTRKKLIIALSVIFVLGFITGAAVTPYIMHELAGNPYAQNKIAERVFNTKYLEKCNLNDDQEKQVIALLQKYTEEYQVAREVFNKTRASFYNGFLNDLSTILTPEQFSIFREHSDKDMKEREEWHKKMRIEQDKKKQ